MLKRYKEIVFGLLLGCAMWLMDAAMHARMGAAAHSSGFWDEVFRPGPTVLAFRAAYLALAVGFGYALWRANWRERELKALEEAFTAFNRQLGAPAVRLVSHSRMLCGCGCVARDDMAASLAQAVHEDARAVDYLAQQYLSRMRNADYGLRNDAQIAELTKWLKALPPDGKL